MRTCGAEELRKIFSEFWNIYIINYIYIYIYIYIFKNNKILKIILINSLVRFGLVWKLIKSNQIVS
ncbi:MAG: hypothetical protein N7Q72_05805, partial [Spiroplasma sp. Tabriz.8]|nr:hypothetical protein [Spiroplasma sp. Tabriz.8]